MLWAPGFFLWKAPGSAVSQKEAPSPGFRPSSAPRPLARDCREGATKLPEICRVIPKATLWSGSGWEADGVAAGERQPAGPCACMARLHLPSPQGLSGPPHAPLPTVQPYKFTLTLKGLGRSPWSWPALTAMNHVLTLYGTLSAAL